jgi:hypothetical protein
VPARWMLLTAIGIALLPRPAYAEAVARPPPVDPWALYDHAFAEASAGHEAEALILFRTILQRTPDAAAAPYAAEMVRLLEARHSGIVTSPTARTRLLPETAKPLAPLNLGGQLWDEQPTSLARAELVGAQTLHGVAFGLEMGFILKVSDPKTLALFLMLGGGAGMGLSLAFTRDGITPGHALALNSGTAWGAWNGVLVTSILGVESLAQKFGLLAVSQFAGLATGNAGFAIFHPSAGDVSLVNSGGLWTALLAAFIASAANGKPSDPAFQITLMAASDVGLLIGAVMARRFPMSRGRVLLIDTGGFLGTLMGVGLAVIVGLDQNRNHAAFFSRGAIGTVAGLGTSAFLTRRWDLPEAPAVRLSVAPTVGGGQALGLAYDF